MTATQDATNDELQRTIAELRQELAARTTELAQRNSEYGARIEHQSATIDVLKAMSASPGDAQPVFDLIVERARDLCDAYGATVYEFDGALIHYRAATGVSDDARVRAQVAAVYPIPATRFSGPGRAILDRQVIRIDDLESEPGLHPTLRRQTAKSGVFLPLLRGDVALGALAMGSRERGGFSDSQIELLRTFAEQAVIAITSAETYRALQTRTSDLQASLEYQTATSDVLKVISRSTFDLQPVLETLIATAARLCDADTAGISSREGDTYRVVATYSNAPAFDTFIQGRTFTASRASVTGRTVLEGRIVHVADLAADPEYAVTEAITLGGVRTLLGVPLLREGAVAGVIILGRFRVQPFTDRQIELVRIFADQAVIAIENTRLITEQREALEQQTAIAKVLQVITASPGNLTPVFETILEEAIRLCESSFGTLTIYDDECFHTVAMRGVAPGLADAIREPVRPSPGMAYDRLARGAEIVHMADITDEDVYRLGNPIRRALADQGGARTALFVALRRDDALYGAFVIYRQEVRPFSDRQIGLLQSFAAQAVIAMENARLLGELRQRTGDLQESLEYQTATSDVLKVISQSAFDLRSVLQTVVTSAVNLCHGERAVLYRYRDGRCHFEIGHNVVPEYEELERKTPMAAGRDTLVGRTMLEKRAVQIGDPLQDPEYGPKDDAKIGNFRSALGVPLLRDGELVGVFGLSRIVVEPFTERQIELVTTFADQAVIAMENARLISEQREALEQQTATAEVLQVINASPGDLTPVFDAMLEKAMRLCEAAYGVLRSYNGEHLHMLASRGVPTEYAEFLARSGGPGTLGDSPMPGTAPMQALETRQPVQRLDVKESMGYTSGIPATRAIADLGGARTVLHVPLAKDQIAIGLLTFYRQEVRAFSDKQIALLQNFAAQAVIAMENARLITETREALEQQTATAEVLRVINVSPGDLAPVFDAILEKAHRLCGATHGSLTLFDGERFRAVATYGHSEVWAERLREGLPAVNNPGTEPLLDGARFVHIADMVDINHPLTRAAAEATGVRTALFVPLRKDNRLIGAISAHRREVRPFTEKEIALLENFAAQAVIAMENARLINETREALAQQTATAEVLQVINASPGDLAPVFDAMLDRAMRLCDGAQGTLWIFDGEHMRATATAGYSTELAEQLGEWREIHPLQRRLSHGERVFQIIDLAAEELYRSGNPLTRAAVDVAGIRTVVFVALVKDATTLGGFTIGRREVRAFTDKQIALLQNFAAQAVIAIENARLLGELRARTDELTRSVAELQALEEVMRAVNSSLELETVLSTIISRAVQLSDADEGTIYEYDVSEQVFVPKSAFGMSAERVVALRERRIKLGETHLGRSAVLRAPVYVEDVQQDPSVPNASEVLPGIHAVLAVPLLRNDTVIGGLVIRRRTEEGFAETIVTLMQTFSGQAVLAIENARLFQEAGRARTAAEVALADLQRTQDQLVQSQKMASLGQLTAGIAHEIKNPLNFVNNFSDLSVDLLNELQEAVAPDKLAVADDLRAEIDDITTTLKGNLEKIVEHGRRADGIVKNMLLHSRTGPSEQRAIDVNMSVEEALNLAYHGARAETPGFNITMEKDLDPKAGSIDASPQEFLRVMLNLISNGFYAARKRANAIEDKSFEPTLHVATRDLGSQVEIRVRDNGTGIGDEVRDKIFEPFFTTKPAGEGTGLGLSLSYDIVVKQHGGQLTVDSRPNEFTEFQIILPRRMATNEGGPT